MDLTPLYDLRERLKTSAIAGTNLMNDDFRLQRVLDNFAPLAGASPIFGKVSQLTQAALAPDCADRPGTLLDALTLADALLCTQGAVAVAGQWEPLPELGWGNAVTNAPYSVIAPLLDALQNSGGGRYSLVMDAHEQHPEYFADHRVKAALVKALGASYTELADQAAAWLKADSPAIIPLIKQGFDPKGKKEMVRRVEVIETLAGADENDFYLEQLENAEKDVKIALIYALRHDPANRDKLLSLAKSEKGNTRDTVRWALAELDDPAVWDYWQTLAAKKPQEAGKYLAASAAENACTLVTDALLKRLAALPDDDAAAAMTEDAKNALCQLIAALPGKDGAAVHTCFRQAAALGERLDRVGRNDAKKRFYYARPLRQYLYETQSFSQFTADMLLSALIRTPEPKLTALAQDLYDEYGSVYLQTLLTAKFLTEPAADNYCWVADLLAKKSAAAKQAELITPFLAAIWWEEGQQKFVLHTWHNDPRTDTAAIIATALPHPLDERFYDLLMAQGDADLDDVLSQWIQPQKETLCQKLGRYFYQQALRSDSSYPYLAYLRQCRFTDCTNLLVNYYKRNSGVDHWLLHRFIDEMPGTDQAKACEVQRLYDAIASDQIPPQAHFNKEHSLESLQNALFELNKSIAGTE